MLCSKQKPNKKRFARIVCVSESTISCKLKRNKSKRGYSAQLAQEYADERKERFRRKRKFTTAVEKLVRQK